MKKVFNYLYSGYYNALLPVVFLPCGDNPTFDYFVSGYSSPVSMITWDITIAYISFFTFYSTKS